MKPIWNTIVFPALLVGCMQVTPPPEIPVSFAVIDVQSGQILMAREAERPMLPASTAKLVTALAVLDQLAPDHRFETRLCREGVTLRLIGGGDPALDVEDVLALVLAARSEISGVERFTFAPATIEGPIQPNQPADAAYNPVLADLMVAEGAYRGHRGNEGAWTIPSGAPIPGDIGTDWFAHPNPPRQAAELMREYATGLGAMLPAPEPGSSHCELELAAHRSLETGDLVREMLWTSSNPMAEILGREALGDRDPSLWLSENHPNLQDLSLSNFSGLDATARVTARDMAKLLAAEANREINGTSFPALLTPAGWDGGLRNRLTTPPVALSVWAKTGTMHYGVGLAGYALLPDVGLVAIAFYAFDPGARERYDPFTADAADEARALDWIKRARSKIDAALTALFQKGLIGAAS